MALVSLDGAHLLKSPFQALKLLKLWYGTFHEFRSQRNARLRSVADLLLMLSSDGVHVAGPYSHLH